MQFAGYGIAGYRHKLFGERIYHLARLISMQHRYSPLSSFYMSRQQIVSSNEQYDTF